MKFERVFPSKAGSYSHTRSPSKQITNELAKFMPVTCLTRIAAFVAFLHVTPTFNQYPHPPPPTPGRAGLGTGFETAWALKYGLRRRCYMRSAPCFAPDPLGLVSRPNFARNRAKINDPGIQFCYTDVAMCCQSTAICQCGPDPRRCALTVVASRMTKTIVCGTVSLMAKTRVSPL